jgi:hypothetical protein
LCTICARFPWKTGLYRALPGIRIHAKPSEYEGFRVERLDWGCRGRKFESCHPDYFSRCRTPSLPRQSCLRLHWSLAIHGTRVEQLSPTVPSGSSPPPSPVASRSPFPPVRVTLLDGSTLARKHLGTNVLLFSSCAGGRRGASETPVRQSMAQE